jgi:hypothetical protein
VSSIATFNSGHPLDNVSKVVFIIIRLKIHMLKLLILLVVVFYSNYISSESLFENNIITSSNTSVFSNNITMNSKVSYMNLGTV